MLCAMFSREVPTTKGSLKQTVVYEWPLYRILTIDGSSGGSSKVCIYGLEALLKDPAKSLCDSLGPRRGYKSMPTSFRKKAWAQRFQDRPGVCGVRAFRQRRSGSL